MKFTIFAIALFTVINACKVKSNQIDYAENKNLKTYTYLALGDSYTIGESVDLDKNFPNQLAASLKNDSTLIEQPKIVAKTGWTTDELISAIKSTELKNKYDFVTLLIGVNNQYRGYDIEEYRLEFKQLIEIAINKAENNPQKVFVVSIPDYGVTPFAQNSDSEKIGNEIDQYNQIAQEITKSFNANYLDITPISRLAKTDNSLIADDGLHPSAKMYQLWVNDLVKQIKSLQ
ncbi:SGNH/GDSL hydrolase family protein [Pedobacter psychrophilus]|uniref:SGNH/GDSL hydrolase family protein n=1 Tax=Pedobacter psychrophilus TaxID=1826909 RepID=UPI0009EDCF6D|nr:SGNH/GDSL hydrolase family protein [Pedobacter psychrophilus]